MVSTSSSAFARLASPDRLMEIVDMDIYLKKP